MRRHESADPLDESGSEEAEDVIHDLPLAENVLDDSSPPRDINGNTDTSLQDSDGVQLLNAIALQNVLSPEEPSTVSSGKITKRKRQEPKAPQCSPEKRSKGHNSATEAGEGNVVAGEEYAAIKGKLGRVSKLPRNSRSINQNHHGSKGDVFTLPDAPVVKAGRPKASRKQRKPEESVLVAEESVPEQVNTTRISNASSKRTQAFKKTKTKSKAVQEDNEDSIPSPRINSNNDLPSATGNGEQCQPKGGTKPKSTSHNLPKRPVKMNPRPETQEHSNGMHLHSSENIRGEDDSAEANIGGAKEGEISAEAHENPDDQNYSGPSDDNYEEDDSEKDNKSSSEDIEQSSEENIEDPSESAEIELFGENHSWAVVLEGARDVGVSEQKGERVKRLPKLQTRNISDMTMLISEVKTTYESLLPYQGLDHDGMDGLQRQLIEGLQDITDSIAEISETATQPKRQETIQDIYAHAIPDLVNLLRVALLCRTCDYSQEHDVDALREIIGLQRSILDLCEKATRWKRKPLTERPIISSTKNNIFPYLRRVNKAFETKLDDRVRLRALKEQDEFLRKLRKKRHEQDLQQKEKQKREREESRKRITEDLASQRPLVDRSRNTQYGNNSIRSSVEHSRRHFSPDLWTAVEAHELLVQLQRKGYRNLPGSNLQRHLRNFH